jgi:hypothetical protein
MTVLMAALDRGTQTSNFGNFKALTMSLATSSGSSFFTPGVSGRPEPSSVLTTAGITTETSTPVPRSSARTASLRPTTACLVAQ